MKINLPFLSPVPSCFIFAFALSLVRGPDYAELGDTYPRPKAWFSYVGKIPDDWGFYFSPTIPDFADIGLDYKYHEKWPKYVSGNFQMFFLNISKMF